MPVVATFIDLSFRNRCLFFCDCTTYGIFGAEVDLFVTQQLFQFYSPWAYLKSSNKIGETLISSYLTAVKLDIVGKQLIFNCFKTSIFLPLRH